MAGFRVSGACNVSVVFDGGQFRPFIRLRVGNVRRVSFTSRGFELFVKWELGIKVRQDAVRRSLSCSIEE